VTTGLPAPDDQLGSYRILREIGRGAMGVVYEAIAMRPAGALPTGERVALKLLVFPPLLPPEEREALIVRFAREARALATVRHPFVVQVFDIGEIEGQPYLAMELLSGLNARKYLRRHGPMPLERVLDLGRKLCEALSAVHAAGIVHRDIKPENVVLEEDGSIRLTDFGVARLELEASLTRTGGLIGSPAYMAPEQILGGAVDARADLFSTGVMLYQMLTGELPFQGASLMEVAHRVAYEPPRPLTGVDPGLATVLLRSMEKDPHRRYPTALALGEALGQATDDMHPLHGYPQTSAVTTTDTQASTLDTVVGRRLSDSLPGALETGCARHPHLPVIAFCAACDLPLCEHCVYRRRGRVWCAEHASPGARPAWITRLEVLAIGLLFALLLWFLYPLRW
jgi:serine/threonine-protein kinase